jgi:hypothetical protein
MNKVRQVIKISSNCITSLNVAHVIIFQHKPRIHFCIYPISAGVWQSCRIKTTLYIMCSHLSVTISINLMFMVPYILVIYIYSIERPKKCIWIFCVLYFTILALRVSGAICTHHREHKLQSTAPVGYPNSNTT